MTHDEVYRAYRQNQVLTASPGQLVLLLYDELLRHLNGAAREMGNKDWPGVNNSLLRAEEIVCELKVTLNLDAGEVAVNLDNIYDYLFRRLVEANVGKNPVPLDEARRLAGELRETWESIILGQKTTAEEGPSPVGQAQGRYVNAVG